MTYRLILFLLGNFLVAVAHAGTWEVDEAHTSAKFKVRHMMVSHVQGQIVGAKGSLDLDDKDLSKMNGTVTLNPATLNTFNADRDTHLKGPDFLDVAKYPVISYQITKATKASDGRWALDGILKLRGISKPVVFKGTELTTPIKDPWGNTRRDISASTTINRKDFGINWNKTLDNGGVVAGDDVGIDVEMELVAKTKK